MNVVSKDVKVPAVKWCMDRFGKKLKRISRSIWIYPVLLSLLWGIVFLAVVQIPAASVSGEADADDALRMVGKAVAIAERCRYGNTSYKTLIYEAIRGMFRTLDPYNQFLDEDSFKYMQEQQTGSFYGIGVSFDIRNGQLLIIAPIEGTPAWKLGIKPGDIIVEIEGESTTGITSGEVLKRLRGKKGTKVHITIKRPGVPENLHFEIVRDRISLNSIRDSFMVTPDTAYIRITEFSATTGDELGKALGDLKKRGMTRLILDLRFNGGGLLSAAEDVLSYFLKKGQLIVSTHGRAARNDMQLICKKNGAYRDLPLIVLVNESSASASEIVAGALQDHDRALILGVPTHGKGLVGSQFATKLGTAVQIITAQYFTPSGRFIQKPYNIPHRKKTSAGLSTSNTGETTKKDLIYFTDKGRKVFGGGGITPDIKFEEKTVSANIYFLETRGIFFDFAVRKGKAFKPITPDMPITDEMYRAFLSFCDERDLTLIREDLEKDRTGIEEGILRNLVSVYISQLEGDKIRIRHQAIIKKALELFPRLEALLALSPPAEDTVTTSSS